jgi:hypothetical protein
MLFFGDAREPHRYRQDGFPIEQHLSGGISDQPDLL